MVIPEAFSVTSSVDGSGWLVDHYQGGALQAWGAVEQGPSGEWWVTTAGDTVATTGPYLDEVQALRALQGWEWGQ